RTSTTLFPYTTRFLSQGHGTDTIARSHPGQAIGDAGLGDEAGRLAEFAVQAGLPAGGEAHPDDAVLVQVGGAQVDLDGLAVAQRSEEHTSELQSRENL